MFEYALIYFRVYVVICRNSCPNFGSVCSFYHYLHFGVYPTDTAIVVNTIDEALRVPWLQRCAMNHSSHYKAQYCHRRPGRTQHKQEQNVRAFSAAILDLCQKLDVHV